MPIDNCQHTFEHLARVVLPSYMEEMRRQIATPRAMREVTAGGPKHAEKVLGRRGNFQGCYVLIDNGKAFYVGISRGVPKRLVQHVKGHGHNSASLAFL